MCYVAPFLSRSVLLLWSLVKQSYPCLGCWRLFHLPERSFKIWSQKVRAKGEEQPSQKLCKLLSFHKKSFLLLLLALPLLFSFFFFNSFIESTLRRAHLYHYVCISHTTTKSLSTSAIQILKEEKNDSWVAVLSVQDFFQYLSSISSLIW